MSGLIHVVTIALFAMSMALQGMDTGRGSLFHGDQDPQMPVNQALELQGAYRKAGASVRLEIISGAAHGGPAFYSTEQLKTVRKFLRGRF